MPTQVAITKPSLAVVPESASDVFYFHDDEREVLHADPTQLVLAFDAAHSSAQGVQRALGVVGAVASRLERLPQRPGHWLIHVAAGAGGVAQALNHARSQHSAQMAGATFVSPVYHTESGDELEPVDRIVLQFKPGTAQSDIDALLAHLGTPVLQRPRPDSALFDWQLGYPADSAVPLRVIAALHASPLVAWVQPDVISMGITLNSVPADQYFSLQYYLKNTLTRNGVAVDDNVEPAWSITKGNGLYNVAVLDDGVDEATPDLAGRVEFGWDAFNPDTNEFAPITCAADCMVKPLPTDMHGTAVAGIIAAMQNNPTNDDFNVKEGISGIAPNVSIYPVRIFKTTVPGLPAQAASCEKIAQGIDFAWDIGNAQVISNSWSGGTPCDAVTQAINRATLEGRNGLGAVVIFSVGNASHRSLGVIASVPWPATLPNVIAVSAIDRTGAIPEYTPQGRIDLVAPSSARAAAGTINFCGGPGDVVTTDLAGTAGCSDGPSGAQNYTSHFDGTSAAAPQVAGAAALLLSSEPSLSWSDVRNRLQETADPWGASNTFGAGKINIGRALNPPPPPPPCVPPPHQFQCDP